MFDYQQIAFSWITHQHWLSAAVLFLIGLLYAFQGFRMFRFLLGTSCGLLGWTGGLVVGSLAGLPEDPVSILGAAALAALSIRAYRTSLITLGGGTFLLLGHYLARQFEAPPGVALACALVAAGFGGLLAQLCFRTMTLILTTLHGTIFLVIGFVGLTSRFIPSVGDTFQAWADNSAFLVPGIMAMLCVTGYSVQFSQKRGDIRMG